MTTADIKQDDDILALPLGALARLMPMFLLLSPDGRIRDAGPTVRKVLGGNPTGRLLGDLFRLRRPRGLSNTNDVIRLDGMRLHLQLIDPPMTSFRGIAVRLRPEQGTLLNLSFSIGVSDAVRLHDLTDADFAPTDLTVEMLYLAEAKTAVMEELRALNKRLQEAKAEAEEQALTDTLTGLANRRAMDQEIEALISEDMPFGIAHIDLDFFKQVNDTLGHAAGDHVLQVVGRVLRNEIRAGDVAARIGGDEFVLIFRGLSQLEFMGPIADRIIEQLSKPIAFRGERCRISASIGMTVSTLYDLPRADRMLMDADRALYASKSGGRGRATAHADSERRKPDDRRRRPTTSTAGSK